MMENKDYFAFKVRKAAKIRNRYNQIPHLTQDTTCEKHDKNTIKHHKKSQEVSPFTAGEHTAAMNRRESIKTQDINSTIFHALIKCRIYHVNKLCTVIEKQTLWQTDGQQDRQTYLLSYSSTEVLTIEFDQDMPQIYVKAYTLYQEEWTQSLIARNSITKFGTKCILPALTYYWRGQNGYPLQWSVISYHLIWPRRKNICIRSLRPGKFQLSLLSYRDAVWSVPLLFTKTRIKNYQNKKEDKDQ